MGGFISVQFLVPLVVSLVAVGVSMRANSIAKRAAADTKDAQERAEIYEHYPLLSISAKSVANQISLTIRNDSPSNASSKIVIEFTLRITTDTTFSVDQTSSFDVDPVAPNNHIDITPEQINKYVEPSLQFLDKANLKISNFVLRVVARYSSPHPQARQIAMSNTTHYEYSAGALTLANSQ